MLYNSLHDSFISDAVQVATKNVIERYASEAK